ncbi:class I SAM-dependent methyltransferase [Flavobacterium aquiphilum]|uniref:class I SAM-dependent methyltransferase n=1 Tax=Flavobacterium aquiphilum TaxID=3003261 RepID=UPI00248024F8|nr:SAM-dependent methyltransferase [Flavobacterium aquiphilum]
MQRIQQEGPISFRDFMEMALYYPGLGYYSSFPDKIGADGDFYTSANLSDAFGVMIARQIEEMWQKSERKPFKIVEYGAGTGLLCQDILDYLKNNSPTFYDILSYCIIEKSSGMRKREKKLLNEKVSWYNSIQEIEEINGCILSNELIDNFSVHRVVMEDQLMEVFVDFAGGFIEVLKPANKELVDYFASLDIELPRGFRTEVNLQAHSWIQEIAKSLNSGYVITIDYGAISSELYEKYRSSGTLLCYYKHHKNDNPYQFIGEQDITSHVNFSALINWGNKSGLNYCGMTNQASFLLSLGIKEYQEKRLLNTNANVSKAIEEANINYRLLMDMGLKFKVLIQEKNVPKFPLMGLRNLTYEFSSKAV